MSRAPEGTTLHHGPASLPVDIPHLVSYLTATGPTRTLHSPVSGAPVGDLPTSTPQDVKAAADRARQRQAEWAQCPVQERAAVLLRFHDRLVDQVDTFVDLVQRDAGKARLSATEEVLHAAVTARYYARRGPRYLRSERGQGLFPGLTRIDRHYAPKGLIGIIAPWNYPLTMAISDGLAALVAGNAVILKPDDQTPLISLAAVELLEDCGMLKGLWQVVHGAGDQVGPELIDVSDYVCFTGSTATGRIVAMRCADRLIGCSLELGGKNPLLILDDADVQVAA